MKSRTASLSQLLAVGVVVITAAWSPVKAMGQELHGWTDQDIIETKAWFRSYGTYNLPTSASPDPTFLSLLERVASAKGLQFEDVAFLGYMRRVLVEQRESDIRILGKQALELRAKEIAEPFKRRPITPSVFRGLDFRDAGVSDHDMDGAVSVFFRGALVIESPNDRRRYETIFFNPFEDVVLVLPWDGKDKVTLELVDAFPGAWLPAELLRNDPFRGPSIEWMENENQIATLLSNTRRTLALFADAKPPRPRLIDIDWGKYPKDELRNIVFYRLMVGGSTAIDKRAKCWDEVISELKNVVERRTKSNMQFIDDVNTNLWTQVMAVKFGDQVVDILSRVDAANLVYFVFADASMSPCKVQRVDGLNMFDALK